MNTLLIAVVSFVGFIVAYHTYGRWLASKIFGLDSEAVVPSQEMRDDIDYKKMVPKIKILDSELDANPPLDEANWRKVLVGLKDNCKRAERKWVLLIGCSN